MTALPWLLTLKFRAYCRSNYGDYIEEKPCIRMVQRLREAGSKLEPTWGLW